MLVDCLLEHFVFWRCVGDGDDLQLVGERRDSSLAMFASITLSVAVVDGALRVRRSDGDLQLADLRNESDDRLRELVRVEQLAHGKGVALWSC